MKTAQPTIFKIRNILLVLCIVALSIFAFATRMQVRDAVITHPDNTRESITFPFKERLEKQKTYVFTGSIQHTFLSPDIIHITPDDCVNLFTINGKKVNLKATGKSSVCSFRNGFDISIAPYVKPGLNAFNIQIINRSGKGGLSIDRSWRTPASLLLLALSTLVFSILFYLILKRLSLSRTIVILIFVGAFVRLGYLSYTSYNERANDVVGHLHHIELIATHSTIPMAKDCSQCYHPFLYYTSMAIIYKVSTHLSLSIISIYRLFQLITYLGSLFFLVYGVLIFRETLKNKIQYYLATLLWCAWPITVTYGARIGNDAFVYPLFIAAFYYLVKWHKTAENRHFNIALVLGILATFTKTNGLLVLGMLFVLLGIRALKQQNRLSYLLTKKIQIAVCIASVLAIFAIPKCYNYLQGDDSNWIVCNRSETRRNTKRYLGNKAENYVWFDVKTFVNEPYVSTTEKKGGRQWFWNHLLKTALFRNISQNAYHRNIACMVSLLFLIMAGASLAVFLMLKRKEIYEHMPFVLNAVILLAAAIFMRFQVPESSMQEFRYIAWFLLSFIFFYMKSFEHLETNRLTVLRGIWYAVPVLFSALSVSYFFIEP